MASKHFVLREDTVEIYPSVASKYLFYVASVFFIFILIASIFVVSAMRDFKSIMINIVVFLVYLLIFAAVAFFARSRMKTRIIFDRVQRQVHKKSLTSDKLLGTFDDVATIKSIRISGMPGSAGYYYSLQFKSDVYGRGVALTNRFKRYHQQDVRYFEQEILPHLHEMLTDQTEPIAIREAAFTQAVADISVKRFYKSGRTGFYYFNFTYTVFIPAALLFLLSLFLLINDVLANLFSPFDLGVFVFTIILMAASSPKITINKETHDLTKSYLFGLISSVYGGKDFVKFHVIRKVTHLIYTGTSIQAEFKGHNKALVIREFRNTKDIEGFLAETEHLLLG